MISQNTLADQKNNIICTMDAVQGDFLRPPHGTTQALLHCSEYRFE